jgi:hypothetical protein
MPPAQKERANLGEIFVLLAIGLGLADAFIGIFDFTGRSRFTNTVTLFDRDLFRVCFDWSMILVCSILFYFRLARCIAERNLRRRLDVALR